MTTRVGASWHRTISSETAATPTRVVVAGRPVLVHVVEGTPYAVADSCLHRGLSLEGGRCVDGVITCPEHWWRYDLRTGEHLGTPGEYLPTYPARLAEDGVIEVEVEDAAPTVSLRETLLAHARAGRAGQGALTEGTA